MRDRPRPVHISHRPRLRPRIVRQLLHQRLPEVCYILVQLLVLRRDRRREGEAHELRDRVIRQRCCRRDGRAERRVERDGFGGGLEEGREDRGPCGASGVSPLWNIKLSCSVSNGRNSVDRIRIAGTGAIDDRRYV